MNDAPQPPEVMADEDPEMSVGQWLDSMESGWGTLFSSIFTERGYSTVNQLHQMRRGDLQELQVAMRDSDMDQSARRRVRAALRSHLLGGENRPTEG
jgi:hypothetical protein